MSDKKYAFRCKSCGYLEGCDHASEHAHPAACRVCGDGVRFCPRRGTKSLAPENWEKLWEASDERLAQIGLSRDDVEKHEAWPLAAPGEVSRAPMRIDVSAGETVGGQSASRGEASK